MSNKQLFHKTVKLAHSNPALRAKLLPTLLKNASVTDLPQRRFLVAYAHQHPEFRDELCRRLYAARGIIALQFDTEDALKKYLKEHPGADRTLHRVKQKDAPAKKKDDEKGEKKPKSEGGAVSTKNLGSGVKPSQVHGNAVVHGKSKIEDDAEVGGDSVVYGNAKIRGKAKVGGDSDISGSVLVAGSAEISSATLSGSAQVGGKAKLNGGTYSGDVTIVGGTWESMKVKHGQWKDPKGPKAVQENGLKDADVDEILNKIVNKPPKKGRGTKLTDAQIFHKFLQEAKPETRERVTGMSLKDFMDVVKFMASDDEVEAGMKSGGGKQASHLTIPDQHQLRILKDTVKNPLKGKFLGGPTAEEAEDILRTKFQFTEQQIQQLKRASQRLGLTPAKLRSAVIRVATHTKDPTLRRKLAQILKAAEEDNEKEGKFEEGVPADPTENMSPEDKKKWEKYHGKVDKLGVAKSKKLQGKYFRGDDLRKMDLKGADLRGADLSKTDLRGGGSPKR